VKAAPIPGFKALRSIRLGGEAHFVAGDLLPRPSTEQEAATYLRLIEQGALVATLDGQTHLETVTTFGPRTVPTIERTPV
jgi:hypothetical protein